MRPLRNLCPCIPEEEVDAELKAIRLGESGRTAQAWLSSYRGVCGALSAILSALRRPSRNFFCAVMPYNPNTGG